MNSTTRSRFMGIRRCSSAHGVICIAILSVGLLGSTCNLPNPTPIPTIPDDGGPAADACEASCRNQRRLRCPGASGKSSPKGRTCEEVCREQSPTYDLKPDCVARASDCIEIKACFDQ